ncbi:prolipoprotein diacylglyceryl transferase [Patescibacteria group bacterium]|nr:prolipoprotein diacylglyceryl transferase [Patescibacteria group bacterium]
MFPILIQLGPITIYSYGFFLTLSYIIATFVLWREGKRQGYKEEKLLDLSLISLFAALIGGSLYFALLNPDIYRDNLVSAIFFWDGNLSFYGGLFGVLVAIFALTKWWKWPFFQIADIIALAGILALFIGSLGAFFAGVNIGTLTNAPWSVEIPNIGGARHPVQLYEAGFAIILFFVMKRFYEINLKSSKFRSGRVFLLSLFFISVSKFFFEFFRAESTFVLGVKSTQIVSLLVAIISFTAIYYFQLRDLREDIRWVLKSFLSVNNRVLRRLKFWR